MTTIDSDWLKNLISLKILFFRITGWYLFIMSDVIMLGEKSKNCIISGGGHLE
jgi:hypothetical protein